MRMKPIAILLCAALLGAALGACAAKPADSAPAATATPETSAPMDQPATLPDAGTEVDPGMGVTPEGGAAEAEPDADLTALLDKIYAKADPIIAVDTRAVDLSEGSAWTTYYTGLADGSKLDAAISSEAMIGSQAYSLVLARVKDKADAPALADEMLANVDERKWICVGADDLAANYHENTVLLVLVDTGLELQAKTFVDAFDEVTGADAATATSRTVSAE